ncbi:MAG: efflux RND transporter periplasmic adaptor subunit [Aquificota bacterium]|nr:MAG: efflux RND transporter periplasmic adaptor subunit [Aquificota bacterium]
MKSVVKFVVFFIVPIIILILWIGGFFSHRVQPGYAAVEGKVVQGVKTAKVETQSTRGFYTVDGTVMANNNAKVATKIMGKILKINVKEGDRVKEGQVLALIDTSDIQQNIKEAKAALEELSKGREEALAGLKAAKAGYEFAKRTYERFKNLYKDNAVSKQQLEEIETKMIAAKAQYEAVQAKLKQLDAKEKQVRAKLKFAEIMKGYGVIKAPFDGIVIKKMNDVGDMAAPGMPLFVIGDNDLRFFAQIDESFVDRVNIGDTFDIHIDSINKTVKGTVVEKNSNIDPMSRSFSVKMKIPYVDGISSGMYGKFYIPTEAEKEVFIPKSAIVKWGQLDAVYKVDKEGILHLTFVKLGKTVGDKVQVLSGVQSGDEIVVSGTENACDGCKIR